MLFPRNLPQKMRYEILSKETCKRPKKRAKETLLPSRVCLDILPAHLASNEEVPYTCQKRPSYVKRDLQKCTRHSTSNPESF